MKDRIIVDIGKILDEVFQAAEDFRSNFEGSDFSDFINKQHQKWDEKTDFYPSYSYPPVNIYLTPERHLVFEFALAGFEERQINLEFKGDYMVLSAKVDPKLAEEKDVKYFKKRLKLKDIEDQKYFVPDDKFDRENTTAKFKNGILTVDVPPVEDASGQDGIKVEIIQEENE